MNEQIPKRFIRVWKEGCGKLEIPPMFEEWWQMFQELHPTYEFITIVSYDQLNISSDMMFLLERTKTCAGISDILRIISLYQLGGIYVDTDVMPLRSFDKLTGINTPFLAKRSSKSLETAVFGSPKHHKALFDVLEALPNHWKMHYNRHASVQTGPAFVSSILFGRPDVMHLPRTTFYPYNGWGGPSKSQRLDLFKYVDNFPPEMLAAHFSNKVWGANKQRKEYISQEKENPWWD